MRSLAAAGLLLVSSFAHAAESNAAAAVELSKVALPRATWEGVVDAMNGQMEQMMVQLVDGSVPEADRAVALEAARASYKEGMGTVLPSYEEMLDLQASLLSKHFTAGELKALTAFYRSPAGQKSVKVMPEVMRDAMGWMQARMQQRLPAMVEKMKATAEAAAAKRAQEPQK